MFAEIKEKIKKSNEQRIKMALTLINVMKQSESATIQLRSSVAASVLDMLQNDMMPEDDSLIKCLNEGIDSVCEDAKSNGIYDLRNKLNNILSDSRKIIAEKIEREEDGSNILNTINFN